MIRWRPVALTKFALTQFARMKLAPTTFALTMVAILLSCSAAPQAPDAATLEASAAARILAEPPECGRRHWLPGWLHRALGERQNRKAGWLPWSRQTSSARASSGQIDSRQTWSAPQGATGSCDCARWFYRLIARLRSSTVSSEARVSRDR